MTNSLTNRIILGASAMGLLSVCFSAYASPVTWDDVGIPGVYSVPVSAELQPFGSYAVARVCYVESEGKLYVGYSLPSELTGTPVSDIQLSGDATKEDTFLLHGDHHEAKCQRDRASNKMSCRVTYANLKFDLSERKNILTHEYTDAKELEGRLRVAELFSTEPIGIIEFSDTVAHK